MFVARSIRNVDRLHRCLAAACAALVFALTIFAASPVAHQWLHVDNAIQADHDCAVVLFASGVSLPVGPVHVCPPTELANAVSPTTAAHVFLVTPRYLRQPERGPPASWVS
jgi:hypothetical protein